MSLVSSFLLRHCTYVFYLVFHNTEIGNILPIEVKNLVICRENFCLEDLSPRHPLYRHRPVDQVQSRL